MAALRDAFMNGRERARARSKTADGPPAEHPASTFGDGAEWIRQVLVPAIDRGNAELQPLHIAFQLDLNLDPRSTNHAHADFWLSELGEGQRAVGPNTRSTSSGEKMSGCTSPVRRGGISARSIAAGPMRSRRCSRTPPRSSAGWRGDFPVIPRPSGMQAGQQKHRNKGKCCKRKREIYRLGHDVRNNLISGHDCLLESPSAMTAPCAYGERGDRMRVGPGIIFFSRHMVVMAQTNEQFCTDLASTLDVHTSTPWEPRTRKL